MRQSESWEEVKKQRALAAMVRKIQRLVDNPKLAALIEKSRRVREIIIP
jgi:hypothetical protein